MRLQSKLLKRASELLNYRIDHSGGEFLVFVQSEGVARNISHALSNELGGTWDLVGHDPQYNSISFYRVVEGQSEAEMLPEEDCCDAYLVYTSDLTDEEVLIRHQYTREVD